MTADGPDPARSKWGKPRWPNDAWTDEEWDEWAWEQKHVDVPDAASSPGELLVRAGRRTSFVAPASPSPSEATALAEATATAEAALEVTFDFGQHKGLSFSHVRTLDPTCVVEPALARRTARERTQE